MFFLYLKRNLKLGALFLVVFLVAGCETINNPQLDPMAFPLLQQYVSDFSDVLMPHELTTLNSRAIQLEKETSAQIVTVLFPHRQGNELIDIGLKLFRVNQLGQKDKNNGLLLLIATEEKKIRIVVWYGLEWDIPDVLASDIIEHTIRPLVNSGNFAAAVNAYYERVGAILRGDKTAMQVEASTPSASWDGNNAVWPLLIGIVRWLLMRMGNRTTKWIAWIGVLWTIASFVIFAVVAFIAPFLMGLMIGLFGSIGGRGLSGFGWGWWGFGGGGGSSGGGGAGD